MYISVSPPSLSHSFFLSSLPPLSSLLLFSQPMMKEFTHMSQVNWGQGLRDGHCWWPWGCLHWTCEGSEIGMALGLAEGGMWKNLETPSRQPPLTSCSTVPVVVEGLCRKWDIFTTLLQLHRSHTMKYREDSALTSAHHYSHCDLNQVGPLRQNPTAQSSLQYQTQFVYEWVKPEETGH